MELLPIFKPHIEQARNTSCCLVRTVYFSYALEDTLLFIEAQLKGAYIITSKRIYADRDFAARAFCQYEFETRGSNSQFAQYSISFNRRGTPRGMHYQ